MKIFVKLKGYIYAYLLVQKMLEFRYVPRKSFKTRGHRIALLPHPVQKTARKEVKQND
jgi:hypothetical protein